MIRLTWRQARPAFATCAAILLAFAAFAVYTEREMSSYIAANGLATCTGGESVCGILGDAFKSRFGGVLAVSQFIGFVPVLIGAFWGAPLIAREIESGTHRMVWTQSVGRGRWLAMKAGTFLLAAAAVSAILTWLMTWWLRPLQYVQGGGTVGPSAGDRISPNVFSFMGIAPVAYTLFAFCVGAAAGAVIKKVVPAMVAAIILYVPPRILMARSVRPTIITPETVSYPAGTPSPRTGMGDWILSNNLVDTAGHPINIDYQTMSAACQKTMGPNCYPAGARFIDTYQSLARFWPLQFIEAGVFIGLGALCLAFTVWWTMRRAS